MAVNSRRINHCRELLVEVDHDDAMGVMALSSYKSQRVGGCDAECQAQDIVGFEPNQPCHCGTAATLGTPNGGFCCANGLKRSEDLN